MEPFYMNENRYSYRVGYWKPPTTADYEAESPETEFERLVQTLFMEGQTYLNREEYLLALSAFRELMALILRTANPQMPVDPNQTPWVIYPMDVALVNTLTTKAAEILQKTPVTAYKFPPSLMSEQSVLPESVEEKLKPAFQQGLQITSHHLVVNARLEAAFTAVEQENYKLAQQHYAIALEKTPEVDLVLRASLLHDMAILAEKSDDRNKAQELAQRSVQTFKEAKLLTAQVQALDTLTGILRRAGKEDLATKQAKIAFQIRKKNNISPVIGNRLATLSGKALARPIQTATLGATQPLRVESITLDITQAAALATGLKATPDSTIDAPTLMAMKFVQQETITKVMNIQGAATTVTIKLDGNAAANVKGFLQTLRDTNDWHLIADFWKTGIQMVAYLPHMYFFVIPMCIGDCLAGMGDLLQAADQYSSVLPYPFINKNYEIVKLWTRLAQVYLDMGDKAYREAKDDIKAFGPARTAYENIAFSDNTLNTNSPLYQDAKFAAIKTRVTDFLAAPDPVAHDDNPAIMVIVLGAINKLQQINAELNFFGLPLDSPPPFSFEYMQNTARYFAQQASQIEQHYIQYMDKAEDEEFQLMQLGQQLAVATLSEELEQRGIAEANAGVAVATSAKTYAETQLKGAQDSKELFDAQKDHIVNVEKAYAWNSVGDNEELQQNVYDRVTTSNTLQSDKLQDEIESAWDYYNMATEQVEKENKRKEIADMRLTIAQYQKKHAQDSYNFLSTQEFGVYCWIALAWQAKYLNQRYLDMATQIALLMERAYNAETERNVHIIRSNYSLTETNNLMRADQLLVDIDSFTYDYITTVRTKKIPVKQIISLASSYPMTFYQLKTTGRCFFQTELADFDRMHPGMYLCKLRNVELVFVGLGDITSLAGSLRNVGVSRFRSENGDVFKRLYPSSVMALSQYDIRQDALSFRFNPNELRLFENNGIDTLWQLDLPFNANDFDYEDILDIQMVIYFDGFFSPSLEKTIVATLPVSGTAGRGFSMRLSFFDELYYLKNKGEGVLRFDESMFPHSQMNLKRTAVKLKALGKPEIISGLTIRLTSVNHGSEIVLKADAKGEVTGEQVNILLGESMIDQWTLHVTAADNLALVNNGIVNLNGLDDIQVFFEFSFDYR